MRPLLVPFLMAPATTNSLLLLAFLAVLAVIRRLSKRRSVLPLPPGPKKLPIVGNLFDMPAERQWEAYHQWSQEYNSDIIHLDVAGTSIIVLDSVAAVRELFERRSSIYSDRGRFPMLVELMGWHGSLAFMKYGDLWRAHRKMMHDSFNVTAAKQFRPQETAAAHELLRNLLRDPDNVMPHFRHMAGRLIMDMTYGITVRAEADPYIDTIEEAMRGLSIATIPGAFLVDMFPVLKYVPSWFPGANFKRRAARWRKVRLDAVEVPFEETRKNVMLGTAVPSYVSTRLQKLDTSSGHNGVEEELIRHTAADIYAAGSDTTVSALGWFVFAMLAYPEVQRKAQAELDAVLGNGHLPTFEDQSSLPYVTALVKEVLRWRSVAPIAIPHYVAVEDEYRGYRIPAGSIVVGNAWALLHDNDIYPDHESFKPERFLIDGKLNPDARDPDMAAFGFGRRICPGRHMAMESLFISVASILATLKIEKCIDEHGNTIEPTYDYLSGLITAPLPLKCSITPRSSQAAQAIQATSSTDFV
ncbi:cytochrome P450 [Mycena amicta]|nr:cytochrome P450 [Mycena amicta]